MIAVAWTALGLLAATLAGTLAALYHLGGRIDETNARIDGLGARLDARLDGLGARLDETNARIDRLGARLDETNARIDALGARIDAHEERRHAS